jgi:hypothetical protein
MFEVEGNDGVILTLGDGWCNPNIGTIGASVGWCNPQCLNVSMNVLQARKHYKRLCGDLLTVHQRKCTLGKMEISSHLASNKITNLWVKLCNLCRV